MQNIRPGHFAVWATTAALLLTQVLTVSSQDFTFRGQTLGEFTSWNADAGLLIYSAVLPPSLPDTIDKYLIEKGDLETDHWSKRVYWRGSTEMRQGGDELSLSSRVTYDQWVRIELLGTEIKTRLLQDTKWIEWTLKIASAGLDSLRLVVEVTNIKGLPSFIKDDLFKDAYRTEIVVPLPSNCGSCRCNDLVERMGAKYHGSEFALVEGDTVRIDIEFTVEDVPEVLKCVDL